MTVFAAERGVIPPRTGAAPGFIANFTVVIGSHVQEQPGSTSFTLDAMSDTWEVKSDSWINPIEILFNPAGPRRKYWVVNKATGEWRVLYVEDGQSVGEAISEGQFDDAKEGDDAEPSDSDSDTESESDWSDGDDSTSGEDEAGASDGYDGGYSSSSTTTSSLSAPAKEGGGFFSFGAVLLVLAAGAVVVTSNNTSPPPDQSASEPISGPQAAPPTAAASLGYVAMATVSGLAVYASPSLDAEIVATLAEGDSIRVLDSAIVKIPPQSHLLSKPARIAGSDGTATTLAPGTLGTLLAESDEGPIVSTGVGAAERIGRLAPVDAMSRDANESATMVEVKYAGAGHGYALARFLDVKRP